MNLFRKRQAPPPANLEAMLLRLSTVEAEVHKVASEVRAYQTELIDIHGQVQKWMRRTMAEARNQERDESAADSPATPAPPPPRLWGARGRRAARAAAAAADVNGGGD